MNALLLAFLQVGLGAEEYAVRRDVTAVVGLANQFLPLDPVLDLAIKADDLEVRWRASALRGAILDPGEVSPLRFTPGDWVPVALENGAELQLALQKLFRPTALRALTEKYLSPRNAARFLNWASCSGWD